MKIEIIVFKNNNNGEPDFMEYNPKKSHEQLEAELTEVCGVNATTAQMMGKIIVQADATGFGFKPATLDNASDEQAEYVNAVAAEFALLIRHVIFGTPLVVDGMSITVNSQRSSGALTLLAEDIGGRVKTAMGKQ